MYAHIFFIAIAAALPAVLSAQSNTERIEWLRRNVSPIQSISMADTNFSDLVPLARAIGSRRVVLLGEQAHGDGATFEAKARVIRYLYERQGFDLLVFESGFYDCRRTWQDTRAGIALADSAINCMFELWSNSQQVRPLLAYMDSVRTSSRPLELAGMDFQASGRRSRALIDDLAAFLGMQADTAGNGSMLQALGTSFGYLASPATRPRNVPAATADSIHEATRRGRAVRDAAAA